MDKLRLICKKLIKKLFFLPPWLTVIIALPSFVFVFVMLATGENTPLSYLSYALSAYALIITATGIVNLIRQDVNNIPLLKKSAASLSARDIWTTRYIGRRYRCTWDSA